MKNIQFHLLVMAAVCSLSSCVGDPFYGYGYGYSPLGAAAIVPAPGYGYPPPPLGIGYDYGYGYGYGYHSTRPPAFRGPPPPPSRLSTGLRGTDFRSPDVRRAPDSTLRLLR